MGLVEKEANKECMENNEEGIELLIEILESVRANRFLTILTRVISACGGDLKWHTNQP